MLTTVEKVLYLQECDLFAGISSDLLAEMAALADEVEISAGDIVYAEGDSSDSVFVIVSGGIEVKRAAREVTHLGGGDVFGAWALLEDGARLFTATADRDTHLLTVHRLDLEEFMADHTRVSAAILKALAHRLRRLAADG
jgi:CRP-like cAMP-binding protein